MLRLRNTLTRQVEPVEPLEPGRVRMYTCGPTVYRYAHVGNLRSNLLADLIRRTLLYHGLDVLHVKNITDVGHLRDEGFDRGADPMLVQAGLESKTPAEIAAAYEAAFHADEALVNILPAHVFPRATEHIEEMLALAEALEDAGYAYATPEGNVYYDVAAFDGYGRLSGNTLADLRAGHRGDVEPDKRDPADFALWKAAGPGRLLKWPTARWGEGFPGWHLECSAMAMRYLGPRFDIHTGGIDNVFPHHEDEIAQSAPIVGDVPARHWVHGEFLLMDGKKMAKSAGNFQRVTELVERGIDPLAFRYLLLTSRYSRKLEYSDRSLACGRGRARVAAGRVCARSGPPPAERAVGGAAGARGRGRRRSTRGHRTGCRRARRRRVRLRGHGPRHVTVRSPVARRPRVPRSLRRGDRRRPGHAGRAGAAARDPALDDRRRTSGAGSSSMPMRSSASTSIASGRRRPPRRPFPTRSSPSSPTATRPGRRATIRRPTACGRGSTRSAGTSSTRRPARRSVRGLIGRGVGGAPRPPASEAARQPRGALATAGWTRRSRREPKRSMIR